MRQPLLPLSTALFFSLSLSLPASVESRTWYVKVDGTGDAPTIQAGIDSAQAGDDVLLAPGLYNSGNQPPWGSAGSMVAMKSGVWLHSESGPRVTVLDAAHEGGRLIECYGVSGGAVIEGLTITGGNEWQEGGGGIYCEGSTVTIRSNVFVDNWTTGVFLGQGQGGGVHLFHSFGEITGNTFIDNIADQGGAAIGCDAYSAPNISRNIIAGSRETGALACDATSSPSVDCNAFWNNEAGDGDCALGPDNFSADPMFCDPAADDYHLHEDSPCTAANSPAGCGLVGALPVGCWSTPISGKASAILAAFLLSIGVWAVLRRRRRTQS